MSLDLDKLSKKMDDYLNSAEGEEYFRMLTVKAEIKEIRLKKVEKYLEGKDFEQILERLIKEHNDDYRDKCYKKGYEPYPNHKFELLFDYISEEFSHVDNDLITQDFLAQCYFFKGYYFTVYCGQGCFYRVYDSKFKHILQI